MLLRLLQLLGKPLLFTLWSGEGVGIALFSCVVGSDAFREGPGEGAALVTRPRVEMAG